jgi:hypothetical protein
MGDWFNVGRMPGDSPITSRQLWFIRKNSVAVLDVLEPRERCSVELMGYEEWSEQLTKAEASSIIGVLKGDSVARDVTRRTEARASAVAKSIERSPSKKWFDTGFGGRSDG